ncbi:G1 family glutamic endopeptidase [Caballeronia sp. LZ035]|uniref:G1 family glutamic endopeptidase n=1 Tax=Caballeronia sp. LZ035 TaxID=3038568 RepID=UPI002865C69A|nr:G1 family glutamic endopeptidase [Caballeronia sp. LZ035]MDR5762889.1 G1 family endopeptidase [Caballeronia sp. LZ035]
MFSMLSWLLIDTTASLAEDTNSTAWAGYAVNNAAYSNVSASWVVPQIDCSLVAAGKATTVLEWVGLGGNGDATLSQTTLEQIGTGQGCNGPTPFYILFYEFFPAAGQYGSSKYPVSAGDTVSARVMRNSDGSYTLSETATAKGAESTKWTFSTTGSSPAASISDPGNRSAEVIMEQPTSSGSAARLPVASYGSITFFNFSYTKANAIADVSDSIQFYEPLDGNTSSTQRAIPAMLSPTSFIIYQL